MIAGLAQRIGARSCVEVAAGDGTLSRFLNAAGVTVGASDDHSWAHAVNYADVERSDAVQAVKSHRPQVVLCSFPPPGNRFEAQVLSSPSVETYLVISTRHQFAAGDWSAYEKAGWTLQIDEALSAMVWPRELDPVVLVLERS